MENSLFLVFHISGISENVQILDIENFWKHRNPESNPEFQK